MLHAVAETPTFQRDAAAAGMSEGETAELIDHLAPNPPAGDIIPGTGKSSAYRMIAHYAGRDRPVFLLTLHGNGERANIPAAERDALRMILSGIAPNCRARAGRRVVWEAD
jgi:hypothetical protein